MDHEAQVFDLSAVARKLKFVPETIREQIYASQLVPCWVSGLILGRLRSKLWVRVGSLFNDLNANPLLLGL